MLRNRMREFANGRDSRSLIHIVSAFVVIVLATVFILELSLPTAGDYLHADFGPQANTGADVNVAGMLQANPVSLAELVGAIRPNMFKAATALRDNPLADKTIERVKSQLSLQCIIELGGERFAYINIKDTGLRKCKVGDCIDDLFTVINIANRSVEATIVGHKVVLSL